MIRKQYTMNSETFPSILTKESYALSSCVVQFYAYYCINHSELFYEALPFITLLNLKNPQKAIESATIQIFRSGDFSDPLFDAVKIPPDTMFITAYSIFELVLFSKDSQFLPFLKDLNTKVFTDMTYKRWVNVKQSIDNLKSDVSQLTSMNENLNQSHKLLTEELQNMTTIIHNHNECFGNGIKDLILSKTKELDVLNKMFAVQSQPPPQQHHQQD